MHDIKKLGFNEKILLDNSIHNCLLKNSPGSEKIWKVLFHLAPVVGGGKMIVTQLAALEAIGFNLSCVRSDYIFPVSDLTILKGLFKEPKLFVNAARDVFNTAYSYYRESITKLILSENRSVLQDRFKKQREHIVGEESRAWYDRAIGDHFIDEAIHQLISQIALDRLMDTPLNGEEKMSLLLMVLSSKYRANSPLKNLGTYRLMQNYFQTLFQIDKNAREALPQYLAALLQKASLNSRKDYLDSESITFLVEGYDDSSIVYLTKEPRLDIECRINVALCAGSDIARKTSLEVRQRPGRIIFFDDQNEITQLENLNAHLGINELIGEK